MPTDVRHALSESWQALLNDMLTYSPGAAASEDIEDLHKFRVALRKTRALRKLFGRWLPQLDRFDSDFRWLAAVTGAARDLDVLLQQAEQLPARLACPATHIAPLRKRFDSEHRKRRHRLQRALSSRRWHHFAERWREFVANELPVLTTPATLLTPAGPLARLILLRQYRRLLGAGIAAERRMSSTQLHRLRIRGKRIRYLLDTLRPCIGAARVSAQMTALMRLQDVLGKHHDAVVTIEHVQALLDEQVLPSDSAAAAAQWIALLEAERTKAQHQFIDAFARVGKRSTRL